METCLAFDSAVGAIADNGPRYCRRRSAKPLRAAYGLKSSLGELPQHPSVSEARYIGPDAHTSSIIEDREDGGRPGQAYVPRSHLPIVQTAGGMMESEGPPPGSGA
jgi:hypothetical protein